MRVPEPFDLDLVVRSHGWYDLAPWRYDAARRRLARPLALSSGRAVAVEVAEARGGLALRIDAGGPLPRADAAEARAAIATCLDLARDLGSFRATAAALEERRAAGRGRDRELPDLRWALARGAGRLLRSPTVFEDAVKTLCTTNCSWALTRGMVARLCERLGAIAPGGARCFPGPAAMAARDERFYREEIRAGYRARALVELARAVAGGGLDVEALAGGEGTTGELLARVRAWRGFGPYAAEHLARLLGRRDRLALDSWTRPELARLRGLRRPPADATVRRWYAPYGPDAGLAMWLEVTAGWFGVTGARPAAPRARRRPRSAARSGGPRPGR